MIDLLALALLALFALIGAVRGTLGAFLRLATLLGSYAAAILGGPLLAPLVRARLELPEMVAVALAGSALFVLTHLVLGVVGWALRSRGVRRRRGLPRSGLDRLGGGALGTAQGILILVLLGTLVSFLDALRVSGAAAQLPELSSTRTSRLVSLSQTVMERGAQAALGDRGPAGRIATRLLSRPAQTVERFQRVLANPRIEALQRDRLFWSYVEHGAFDQALNRGSFLGIAYDRTLRSELAELGMVSPEARLDSRLFRNSVRETLEQVGPRIQRIREDPALEQLARDPEVRDALEAGDPLRLLRHPEFRALVTRALESSPES